eukprot:CAMPEP_0185753870 /NCGR_PEP_ID=MMETSP1174-20130828/12563_1 /TAXON_ID=35687 /ORGANISM="Dictyocha speculum, Strain CCMP1381" /LENGTH=60 /DNA_ID=CAMNT_0028431885 /DNA_START=792 /DNA_END=974 /DNA_ORIENTATION=-
MLGGDVGIADGLGVPVGSEDGSAVGDKLGSPVGSEVGSSGFSTVGIAEYDGDRVKRDCVG